MPVILVAAGICGSFWKCDEYFISPILIDEVFGFNYFPYFFIVCAFAYFFNFDQSIYGKQLKKIQM